MITPITRSRSTCVVFVGAGRKGRRETTTYFEALPSSSLSLSWRWCDGDGLEFWGIYLRHSR